MGSRGYIGEYGFLQGHIFLQRSVFFCDPLLVRNLVGLILKPIIQMNFVLLFPVEPLGKKQLASRSVPFSTTTSLYLFWSLLSHLASTS